jgi:antitoxin YefM
MKSTYSVTEAQAALPRLLREATATERPVAITRRDETVAFIVPRERMEAILETMELLANPDAMAAIRADREGKGVYYPLEILDEDDAGAP